MRRLDAPLPIFLGQLVSCLKGIETWLTSVDHDEELHEGIVNIARRRRLYDENILVSNRFTNRDARLLVGVHEAPSPRDLNPQSNS